MSSNRTCLKRFVNSKQCYVRLASRLDLVKEVIPFGIIQLWLTILHFLVGTVMMLNLIGEESARSYQKITGGAR